MRQPPPFIPEENILSGLGVGKGIAIGPAHLVSPPKKRINRYKLKNNLSLEKELIRFKKAKAQVKEQLEHSREILAQEIHGQAGIFEAHLLILDDPLINKNIDQLINKELSNAEWAIDQSVKKFSLILNKIEDEYIKSRLNDVELVWNSVIAILSGYKPKSASDYKQGSILVAEDISPSEILKIPLDKVAGIITESGSQTSHTAIVAKSISLPAVLGVTGALRAINNGEMLVMDGANGKIVLNPDTDTIKFYEKQGEADKAFQAEIVRCSHLPSITLDECPIAVLGNLELIEELPAILSYGGEGIGLYRTEFLYLAKKFSLPDEEELFELYKKIVETTYPKAVNIRVLDLGADKLPDFSNKLATQNQVLGLRAIRFLLKHPDIFRAQLRAIIRASAFGNVRILLPMISSLEEFRRSRRFFNETMMELKSENVNFNENIPLGIMIEVPAAVIISDLLAREADFFSIGTNDLIQYSLAADRLDSEVAEMYQPLHPAVLRMIKQVVQSANGCNIPVSVCGDMAANPVNAAILIGLGVEALSTPSSAIPAIKRLVRMSSLQELKSLAYEALKYDDVNSVKKMVNSHMKGKYPEFFEISEH